MKFKKQGLVKPKRRIIYDASLECVLTHTQLSDAWLPPVQLLLLATNEFEVLTVMRLRSGSPNSLATTWDTFVLTPCPISMPPCVMAMVASAA